MARQVQLRRGTTAENNNFTGAAGELTFDTSTKAIRAHDGSKKGGYFLDSVVAYQTPNSGNGYTWYRKYASGWIEQGGLDRTYSTGGWQSAKTITFPVAMADIYYNIYWTNGWTGYIDHESVVMAKTTTSFQISQTTNYDTQKQANWQVSGMAA